MTDPHAQALLNGAACSLGREMKRHGKDLRVQMLDPDMPSQQLRLHMGEMTAQEERTARVAIRWANSVASRLPD